MTFLNRNTTPIESINVTDVLTVIIQEIVTSIPAFTHIDPSRMLVCCASNRRNSRGSTFGKLVPMRFKNGEKIQKFRGNYYSIPPLMHENREILYIIYFYMPRFFDLNAYHKLRVILHELYHINPGFNGDIRRMGEYKASHGGSKKKFDEYFEDELKEFYSRIHNKPYMKFLTLDSRELYRTFSDVYARRMKVPRPVRVPSGT